ncbi:hypothetical protein N7530_006217 [Penicillium desertorum]|uniref:Aldehyde dehydrogenase domain-containing protein n=1 Tax=Penicillium desertorum TaxID=1303715 RepID=A0A9W9WR87_9EURO|nr:hypothetical protein N7530_006217 [Penicillium desertorum]
MMSYMGEICTSTSREHLRGFRRELKQYTIENSIVGSQFDPQVNHGPQVSAAQKSRILGYLETGKREGAQLVLEMISLPRMPRPIIFNDTNRDMTPMREEVFGPFVVIQSFKDQKDAVDKANDTEYGLGAALFTENITRARNVAAIIQAGMVWINGSQDSHFAIPFGGYKQRGIGRELSEYALSAYTQVKAVHGIFSHDLGVATGTDTILVNLGTWL